MARGHDCADVSVGADEHEIAGDDAVRIAEVTVGVDQLSGGPARRDRVDPQPCARYGYGRTFAPVAEQRPVWSAEKVEDPRSSPRDALERCVRGAVATADPARAH